MIIDYLDPASLNPAWLKALTESAKQDAEFMYLLHYKFRYLKTDPYYILYSFAKSDDRRAIKKFFADNWQDAHLVELFPNEDVDVTPELVKSAVGRIKTYMLWSVLFDKLVERYDAQDNDLYHIGHGTFNLIIDNVRYGFFIRLNSSLNDPAALSNPKLVAGLLCSYSVESIPGYSVVCEGVATMTNMKKIVDDTVRGLQTKEN